MPTGEETNRIFDPAVEQVTLRVKGEYRRSCLYAVLGFILVAVLGPVLPGRPWGAAARFAVFIVSAFVLWLYVQTWRLADRQHRPCPATFGRVVVLDVAGLLRGPGACRG